MHRICRTRNRLSFLIIACASGEQAAAVRRSLESLDESGLPGASQRLRDAAEHAPAGRHVVAIARSVNAVESVACKIDTEARRALASALHSLEGGRFFTHSALAMALEKTFGSTSDKRGNRRQRVVSASAGLAESLFMFGVCASFSADLAQKHGQNDSRAHQWSPRASPRSGRNGGEILISRKSLPVPSIPVWQTCSSLPPGEKSAS